MGADGGRLVQLPTSTIPEAIGGYTKPLRDLFRASFFKKTLSAPYCGGTLPSLGPPHGRRRMGCPCGGAGRWQRLGLGGGHVGVEFVRPVAIGMLVMLVAAYRESRPFIDPSGRSQRDACPRRCCAPASHCAIFSSLK